MSRESLARLVRASAVRNPRNVAVQGPDGAMSYAELDQMADRVAGGLRQLGVIPGDRVALWSEKSARLVAAMQGVLRVGGAYVPVDPSCPAARAAALARDCSVRAVVTSARRLAALREELGDALPALLLDEGTGLQRVLAWGQLEPVGAAPEAETRGDALAYILYTSGSTGQPKGVCISHRNALAFIDWAATELDLRSTDRLANHAPLHFDLSVFDVYGAFRVGAAVALVDEVSAHVPRQLVRFVSEQSVTVWYSVPSALALMLDRGQWHEGRPSSLRAILFAGEVFPAPQLARLRELLPGVRLLNLYGPTETNVCTWYEVDPMEALNEPVPIGRACSGDSVWARRVDGSVADVGEEGELLVEGPTVMLGYWGREPHGATPYATGDIVKVLPGGAYRYVGRRDQMLKIRGHRVEPGEIEARLHEHPAVREAAVVARGNGPHAELVAFVVPAGEAPSPLSIKQHLAARLPRYMIVDQLRVVDYLPRTSNEKVDRLTLTELAQR